MEVQKKTFEVINPINMVVRE